MDPSIQESPVLKGHFVFELTYKISHEDNLLKQELLSCSWTQKNLINAWMNAHHTWMNAHHTWRRLCRTWS
jgi:hypothetical protein